MKIYWFSWSCIVDDDTFVNIENLMQILKRYNNSNVSYYLGKPSLDRPILLSNRRVINENNNDNDLPKNQNR